jgi:predicted Rossmann fold flavoprotein
MRVAIVGGGAAGLMAAIHAARKDVHIDIYEQNGEVGKKILASGNGRCNVSNVNLGADDYYGRHPDFVTPSLRRFGYEEFERFCERIGLLLEARPDGRVYPMSNEARSVHRAMKEEALRRGARIATDAFVERVDRSGVSFVVTSAGGAERYDRVLIATGSPAAPQLGGSGSGLELARSLGHTIVDPYPTLVGLHLPGRLHERMSGLKVEARVTLYIDGKAVQRCEGDLLFTHYGVSGFAILDISTEASRALMQKRAVTLGFHLLPAFDRQGVAATLQRLAGRAPWLRLPQLLNGLLPQKLVTALLVFLQMDEKARVDEIGAKAWRKLAATICDWRFSVVATHGYRHAETAGGGVSTEEVDAKTMASRLVPGLFFAGEVLDIVGRRGGYNLHFAWASGKLAGENLAKSRLKP